MLAQAKHSYSWLVESRTVLVPPLPNNELGTTTILISYIHPRFLPLLGLGFPLALLTRLIKLLNWPSLLSCLIQGNLALLSIS